MKLKRMWPGICILVIFIIYDVIMAASSGFFSGLFPSDQNYMYSAAFTALGVLITGVLTFLAGKICDLFDTHKAAEATWAKAVYVIALLTIICCGVVYRVDFLYNTTAEPTGKLSLYENAMIGFFGRSAENDLLSILYSSLLSAVLVFTGNKINIALFFQIALFMLFVLFVAIAVRLLLGKIASLMSAGFLSFMPLFVEGITDAKLGTGELFLALFGLELLIIAIFLKGASDGKYISNAYVIWYLCVGAAIGFMTYLDAGTAVVIIPFLLAGLFLLNDEGLEGIFRLVFIILGGAIVFCCMILQEGGLNGFYTVLGRWAEYYFHNLNTFSMFWTYTNYKLAYFIILILMTGVFIGFFRNKEYENVTPWLLATMAAFFLTPFFGATRMNDQKIVTFCFATVLACVISQIVYTKPEEVKEIENAQKADNAGVGEVVNPDEGVTPFYPIPGQEVASAGETDDIREINAAEAEAMINAQVDEPEYYDDEPIDEIAPEEEMPVYEEPVYEAAPVEEPVYEAVPVEEPVYEAVTTEEPVIAETQASAPETQASESEAQDKPRFVPEGMVLPTGSEDEMDVDIAKMRMPKFEGKIGLDRKSGRREPIIPKKDDFDIPFQPGDDFDI